MTVTVVLGEDSYLMREGVSRLLESDQGIHLVATGADLESLLAAVEEHSPDVVVTDIRMPPTSTDEGIQAAEAFRDSHPQLGVVVLSQYDEPEYALKQAKPRRQPDGERGQRQAECQSYEAGQQAGSQMLLGLSKEVGIQQLSRRC